jgi:PmbA protein
MLKKLMELARRVADEVEIYQECTTSTEVKYSNGKADDIQSSILGGTALRLLKNGKAGFSYSRICSEPDPLIEGATVSLTAGIDGPLSFAAVHRRVLGRTSNSELTIRLRATRISWR